jgi:hypothetical protein
MIYLLNSYAERAKKIKNQAVVNEDPNVRLIRGMFVLNFFLIKNKNKYLRKKNK